MKIVIFQIPMSLSFFKGPIDNKPAFIQVRVPRQKGNEL